MNKNFSDVLVLIPTYNEKENVGPLAKAIFAHYPAISLMFVDDNSPDGTAQHVRNLQSEFPNLSVLCRTQNKGFGRSYLDGFRYAVQNPRYEAIVMMDADFSHDPKLIGSMVPLLEQHPAVIGSRYVPGGGIANWKLRRRILSKFANFYVAKILGTPVNDMTTGFTCVRKNALAKLNFDQIKSDGYAFLVEMKYRLHRLGHSIAEHPMIFSERREGESKMSFGIIWESIWLPWKLRLKHK